MTVTDDDKCEGCKVTAVSYCCNLPTPPKPNYPSHSGGNSYNGGYNAPSYDPYAGYSTPGYEKPAPQNPDYYWAGKV
jgi:hypothetical protein